MKKKTKMIGALALALVLGVAMITGCSAGGQKKSGTIMIATKPMTEQLILGEMLSILIQENTDLNVEITKGVGGGTSNIHPALIKGDFDLYPEYTGTAWNNILKKTEYPDDETLWNTLTDEYDTQFGLKWVGMYGFNNTYTLALRKEIADKYNIKTFSDLAKYTPEITFGANPDFYEREDGYQALCDAYGFSFKDHMDMDIGLKYNALNSGEVDVINAYTTDGQLSVADAVSLTDDKGFFKNYYCGTVVREDTLENYPELEGVLKKMDGIITNEEMSKMNYDLEVNNRDEHDVAMEFLKSKGLINE
ncbi:glycine betaine ABC transporter substrate-binding protein [Eubacterium callanderi]|uniref:glycine betaine ABC transporter substrate-binding protein n=1 Tax=Eubacterium callanderi TaxID=53442 RepID=UPI0008EA5993|nr:glycine betaine ABC transporter substrate-binding protein [Eubacterium callanderi]MBU5305522.1 glycine/betaine ABC transporter substrate-binding protein [Eubacterium callanderi]SFP38855.1 glycine betaine/choline-binding (lipo)protein of an ABC-type transport system (osmoprotectant binding protein) [Eubacterium callanderi]